MMEELSLGPRAAGQRRSNAMAGAAESDAGCSAVGCGVRRDRRYVGQSNQKLLARPEPEITPRLPECHARPPYSGCEVCEWYAQSNTLIASIIGCDRCEAARLPKKVLTGPEN